MKKISIIGTGLIGGSLGLALRKKAKSKYFVTAVGRNIDKLKTAKKMGASDIFTTDLKEGVKDADIIVICTPVHLIAPMVKKILPFIKHGAVITDAGSVKGSVLKQVNKVLSLSQISNLKSVVFIGAHPMAGSEKSGISAARAGLYEGAAVVLVKEKGVNKKAFGEIKTMWKRAGANIVEMPAEEHDRAVALISHLPHIMAFGLCLLAEQLQKFVPAAPNLAAGSFKDLTRIAGSNSSDWASICNANKKDVSEAIDLFIAELKDAKNLLNKPGELEKKFEKAKAARQKLLENKP